jgi:hypothetical protein
MKQFREEVREYYKPYYKKRDKDHQIDHADSICDVALKINKDSDKKLVILTSYIYAMFDKLKCLTHNKLAYDYVIRAEDKFLKKLSNRELLDVAYGVL